MKNVVTFAVLGAAAVTLAACGGKLGEAEHMDAAGSAFDRALYNDYITLSKGEYGEGDYTDSDKFAEKAMMAAAGEGVGPYDPRNWNIPANRQAVMNGAHGRLVDALAGAAKDKATVQLARAQTSYDCWVQEQEENFQPDHIAACRDAFIAAMEEVDKSMMVAKPAPAAAPAPMAKMADAKTWEILFKFDSTDMLGNAKAKMESAIAYISSFKRPRVTVSGYTDTSGSKEYNKALSERRSEMVAITAMDLGLNPQIVVMRSYGEDRLGVTTADGVRKQENRRATITVESK